MCERVKKGCERERESWTKEKRKEASQFFLTAAEAVFGVNVLR